MKSLSGKSGAVEQYTITGELTSRDKDHVSIHRVFAPQGLGRL